MQRVKYLSQLIKIIEFVRFRSGNRRGAHKHTVFTHTHTSTHLIGIKIRINLKQISCDFFSLKSKDFALCWIRDYNLITIWLSSDCLAATCWSDQRLLFVDSEWYVSSWLYQVDNAKWIASTIIDPKIWTQRTSHSSLSSGSVWLIS